MGGLEHSETASGRKLGTKNKRTIVLWRPLLSSSRLWALFVRWTSRNAPFRAWVLTAIRGGTSAGPAEGACEAEGWAHLPQVGNVMVWPQTWGSDQIQTLPLSPGSPPAGAQPAAPLIPDHAGEPLKYGCLFLGLLPVPPWCHFQIHYIPMALGSFNYMWRSFAVAGIRRPVLTIYRPQLSRKQGNK